MTQAQTRFRRIRKREAVARWYAGKPVALCPCRLYPGFPWAPQITTAWSEDWQARADRLGDSAWDVMYREWAFYNTGNGAGSYAHYYIEE